MNCPTIDKLAEWFDGVAEHKDESIQIHLKTCKDCQQIIAMYENDQRFLKETLEMPTLPDDFAMNVLNQVEPYNRKKTKKPWKRLMIPAAAALLALGLTSTLHPSFAEWIGGFFSTEQVDEGLRIASESGLTERVNQQVTDQGITFKVEDVLADSSRVALSYQILNEKGKILDPHIDPWETENAIKAYDQDGNSIETLGMGWSDGADYGLIEFSLREHSSIESLKITFELVEINGTKGNWDLEIPIDLKKSKKMTTKALLNEKTSEKGVGIHLKEVQFAPSSNELLYETYFTAEEKVKVASQINTLEDTFGEEYVHTFTGYGTAIQYHIENEQGESVYRHNTFQDQGHPSDRGILQGSGRDMEELGHMKWNESFIPLKEEEQLTFVLDGVMKTVPADFSLTIKPKELRKNPLSFEYEGNFITVIKAHKKNEYSLRKALLPIEIEPVIKIEMEGGKDVPSSDLGAWVLVDDKGKVHQAYHSGSILDEKDENGRFKTTTTLTIYGLKELPEEFTLHLLSVTRYEEAKNPWTVPLYEGERE